MNKFFTDIFNISKINICIRVGADQGATVHRNRQNHGLVIQLNGIKKYVFDTHETMAVKQGDIFYLPKFSNYEVFSIEPGDCIAVNFELSDENITYPFFYFTSMNSKLFQSEFITILKLWYSRKTSSINECFKILYGIIAEMQKEYNRNYIPSPQKKIAIKTKEYIDTHLFETSLSIEALANQSNITPEYLRSLFKKTYGSSPKKYIINTRISQSKDLIVCNEFSLEKISELCGFSSLSYFCQEFKRVTKCTPTQFKMQN